MSVRITVFCLSLGWMACGNDATPADTSAPADTQADGLDTAQGDTVQAETEVSVDTRADGEVDLCSGITCEEPPAATCSPDRLAVWAFGQAGACEVDGDGFSQCRYPPNETRCAEGEACLTGGPGPRCGAPTRTCEVALSPAATWISAAKIPTSDAPCCFDFDGDGNIDNGLAKLVETVSPLFDANSQSFVDAFIARGLNAYLLQYRRLETLANDSDIGIDLLLGYDRDGDTTNNQLGTERFAVRAVSFDGPTPKSSFESATTSSFVMRARSSSMSFLMPLAAEPLAASVRDVRLDARVTLGANGRGLTLGAVGQEAGARFGALFPVSEVFRAVNVYVKDSCGCLDLAGRDLITASGSSWQCQPAGTSACNPGDNDESLCIDLAGYCSAALLLIKPDVGDAISIGLWLQGVSAGLEGFVDAGDKPLVCE